MRKKTPDPAAAELVSNREDAVRFAAAARQAFQEALPPSRVDEIMAEGFRIAEREALKKEQVAKRRRATQPVSSGIPSAICSSIDSFVTG